MMQSQWAQSQGTHLQHTSHLRLRGHRRRESRKTQGLGEFAVRLSSGNIRNNTHKVSPPWVPKWALNKGDTSGRVRLGRESPLGLNPTQRTTGNWGKLGVGAVVWPKSTTTGHLVSHVSPEDMHRRNIWTQQAIFRDICAYTYMHAIIIDEKMQWIWRSGERCMEGLEGGKQREMYLKS